MRKKSVPGDVLWVLYAAGIVLLLWGGGCAKPSVTKVQQVCFKHQCVDTVIVHKKEDTEKGLMFQESLAENAGMLFLFPKDDRHNFWMKNMRFPIDILWLNGSRKITYIAHDVPPCDTDPCPTYGPALPTRYVLEVPAGFCAKNLIKSGDNVEFRVQE